MRNWTFTASRILHSYWTAFNSRDLTEVYHLTRRLFFEYRGLWATRSADETTPQRSPVVSKVCSVRYTQRRLITTCCSKNISAWDKVELQHPKEIFVPFCSFPYRSTFRRQLFKRWLRICSRCARGLRRLYAYLFRGRKANVVKVTSSSCSKSSSLSSSRSRLPVSGASAFSASSFVVATAEPGNGSSSWSTGASTGML